MRLPVFPPPSMGEGQGEGERFPPLAGEMSEGQSGHTNNNAVCTSTWTTSFPPNNQHQNPNNPHNPINPSSDITLKSHYGFTQQIPRILPT